MGKKKREVIRLERESVVPILKPKIIHTLACNIEKGHDRAQFKKLCKRIESTIRAWYQLQFEDMMHLYSLFDPIHGARKIEQQNLTPDELDKLELDFLQSLFQIMEKSNFKIITDEEIQVALSGQYRLNLPIKVNENMLDKRLLTRFFMEHPHDNLPYFADKHIIFRRGIGLDHMTAYFFNWKINAIIARAWRCFLKVSGIKWLLYGRSKPQYRRDENGAIDIKTEDEEGFCVERIRIENMRLSLVKLLGRVTIQEPSFDRIIVVYSSTNNYRVNKYYLGTRRYFKDKNSSELHEVTAYSSGEVHNMEVDLSDRRTKTRKNSGRGIYVKHFKDIPMADMEIVLPEKKNPSLTPIDWVKFLVSAVIGLATVVSSISLPKADIRVIFAILSTVAGYCVKTYFTFQRNLNSYQSLITRSVYEKQLDSGRGTLLHLCDEVIQQEVKEVIVSYFILMERGKAARQDLDQRCEELIKEEFDERCNFDVDDAITKLEKLGIVIRDASGIYSCVDLKQANEIIGTTTEEVVLKAKKGSRAS